MLELTCHETFLERRPTGNCLPSGVMIVRRSKLRFCHRVIKSKKKSSSVPGRAAAEQRRGRRPIPLLRERIISSATKLFGEKRFNRVLTDEVASRAGVGKGSVYRQFSSKELLYAAAVLAGFTQLRNRIENALTDPKSDRERVTTIVRQVMTYFWARQEFFLLLRDSTKLPRTEENRYRKGRRQLARPISSVLSKSGREGGIRADLDFDLLAESLLGMIRGILRYRHDSVRLDESIVTVVSLFLNGCIRE